MKCKAYILLSLFAACAALAGDVLVVRGTSSLPNDGERRYAESVVRGMGRFLDGLGIDWEETTDDEAVAGLLGRYPVVILPYNTTIPDSQFAELRSFVGSGGKLLVFYSADTKLAGLMGFKLGKYHSEDVPTKWCAVRFTADAPKGMPDVFYQESRNIRPVYPGGPPSRVIAYWENARGEKTQYPAIVSGPKGLWMSHVLLADMDDEGKKAMLLDVISSYAPRVEKKAAAKYLEGISSPGNLGSFDAFLAAVKAGDNASVVEYLADRHAKVRKMFEDGRYRECISACLELAREMERVYAKKMLGPSSRIAVWDHSGRGLYVGDWKKTCTTLKAAGVTDVYSNLLWPWEAHFPSSVVAPSRVLRAVGDQAEASVKAAREAGLKLHLWKVCWNVESARPEQAAAFEKQGRLQKDHLGQTVRWLCPSHPVNQRWEKDTLREALRKYEFDGVHLDYIRFKDSSVCFCGNCRRAFEKHNGSAVANWPADARAGELGKKYSAWRVKQISDFVRDVDTMVSRIRPRAEVSAAVFGKYPSCVPSVAQDWAQWVRDGCVDYICPMNYTEDLNTFTGYVDSQVGLVGASRVMPGIGVTARESRLDAFQVVDQIRLTQARKTAGFILFDLNRSLEKGVLLVLDVTE